jgi:hypothetical protein
MVFAYYNRLTRVQQRIYRSSDEISAIALPKSVAVRALAGKLAEALKREERRAIESVCQELVSALTASLKVRPVRVAVLAVRPSRRWGELHGLYNPAQGWKPAAISVWMRTAERHQVVAFRTFLRTLIHEICHHLDYEHLKLSESFHTQGFYKRESNLVHQLVDGLSA